MTPHPEIEAIVYRACAMEYFRAAYGGKGSRYAAGRFNRPNEAAIYAALDVQTAYAEFQGGRIAQPQPCVIVAAKLRLRGAIDLTGDLSSCHADIQSWKSDWEAARADLALKVDGADCASWRCRDLAIADHRSGFVYPSQRRHGGRNVVWYPEDATAGHVLLDVIDDDGKIAIAAKGVV